MNNTDKKQRRKEFLMCLKHNLWFKIFSLTAIGLIIASFVIPPIGVIHPSVMAAVGEIFGFAALGTVIKALDTGTKASITHNNTTLTLDDDDK